MIPGVGWLLAAAAAAWVALSVPVAVVIGRAIAAARRAGDRPQPFDVFTDEEHDRA